MEEVAPANPTSSSLISDAHGAPPRADSPAAGISAHWHWYSTLLAAAAIVLAAAVAYSNSFDGEFMFDDQGWIVDNPAIRQLWPIGDVLFPAAIGRTGGRPVVNLTLAVNYRFGALDVRGYHAVNLAIHMLAALALFGVVRRTLILPRMAERFAAAATPLAAAVALIWVVHPLLTEAVSYVIQRAESLMGLFYLLTLYCVIRGATGDESAAVRRRLWYLAAATACLLGMGTKEVMVTAPVVVLLYDRIFLSGSFRASFARRRGLYAALAATWSVVVWGLATTHFYADTTGFHVARFTPWSYLVTEAGVIVMYLRLAFWPDQLCFVYDLFPPHSIAAVWPSVLLVLSLLAATGWGLVKRPAAGFLGAAFFLILAPTSSFVPILDAAFEHRMYLSLAALIALVILGGFYLWSCLATPDSLGKRVLFWAVPASLVVAVVAGLSWATFARNRDYRSEFAIWNDTVNKHWWNPRAHYNLAVALSEQGKKAEAIDEYRHTIECASDYADAYRNWGSELAVQGKLDEAIALFERAIKARPTDAESHFNLGLALARSGRAEAAVVEFREALRQRPDYVEALNALGHYLGEMGSLAAATAYLNRAIALDPGSADAHNNLGLVLSRKGQFDKAIDEHRRALAIRPDDAGTHDYLAVALANQGHLDEAAQHSRRAVELKPGLAETHNNLAGILLLEHKPDEAISQYRQALKIAPNYAEAHFYLARLLYSRGEAREAIDNWREAARLQPVNYVILNELALALATDPDASLRDGVEAIKLAQRAVQLSGGRDPAILASLAAAEAEAGQYPRAVEIAERALDMVADQPSMAPFAATLRERIKLYEAGSPYHEPPRP